MHQVSLVAIGTLLGSMVCETPAVMKADTAARANVEKCIVERNVTAMMEWTERSTSCCLLKEKN